VIDFALSKLVDGQRRISVALVGETQVSNAGHAVGIEFDPERADASHCEACYLSKSTS